MRGGCREERQRQVEWWGDLWTWMACVNSVFFFLCVGVGVWIMWCAVIACGNLFLVKRRIFAKEGWHYDTWLVTCDVRGLHIGRLARC